uniref:Uncharacterized protein n=1 Tax=Hanusia phi TaxID=3032 RepID=A0A7S0HWJ5_9CRYP
MFRHGVHKLHFAPSAAQPCCSGTCCREEENFTALGAFHLPPFYHAIEDRPAHNGRMHHASSNARHLSGRNVDQLEDEMRFHDVRLGRSRQHAVDYALTSPRERYESAAVLYKESQNLMKYLATISSAASRLQHAVICQQADPVLHQHEDDCPSPAARRCRNNLSLHEEASSQLSPRLLWSEEVLFPSPCARRNFSKNVEIIRPRGGRSVGTQVNLAEPEMEIQTSNAITSKSDDSISRKETEMKRVHVKDVAVGTELFLDPHLPGNHAAPTIGSGHQIVHTSIQSDLEVQPKKDDGVRHKLGQGCIVATPANSNREEPNRHAKNTQDSREAVRNKKLKRVLIRR